jgi:hypothetical protein
MTYQPGIPTGTVNLDEDYLNIQNNFQVLDTQFGVDHVPFSDPSGTINGYHESLHMNPQSTTATNPPNNFVPATATPSGVPVATPGYGQLFGAETNDGVNTDTSLFWLTGGNRMIPLTRNMTPKSATNGYTCLPGGLIIQWGFKASPGKTGTVTFATDNIAFPNACFNVSLTLRTDEGGAHAFWIDDDVATPITKTNFAYTSDSSSLKGFYWIAIGN